MSHGSLTLAGEHPKVAHLHKSKDMVETTMYIEGPAIHTSKQIRCHGGVYCTKAVKLS